MSIYQSYFGFGDEHLPRCQRLKKLRSGVYEEDDSKPCTCGSCPIEYQGSNVLPSNKDKRKGNFGISAIPPHITRSGRDNRQSRKWHPWLRVHLNNGYQDTVILTKKQVKNLCNELNNWLNNCA